MKLISKVSQCGADRWQAFILVKGINQKKVTCKRTQAETSKDAAIVLTEEVKKLMTKQEEKPQPAHETTLVKYVHFTFAAMKEAIARDRVLFDELMRIAAQRWVSNSIEQVLQSASFQQGRVPRDFAKASIAVVHAFWRLSLISTKPFRQDLEGQKETNRLIRYCNSSTEPITSIKRETLQNLHKAYSSVCKDSGQKPTLHVFRYWLTLGCGSSTVKFSQLEHIMRDGGTKRTQRGFGAAIDNFYSDVQKTDSATTRRLRKLLESATKAAQQSQESKAAAEQLELPLDSASTSPILTVLPPQPSILVKLAALQEQASDPIKKILNAELQALHALAEYLLALEHKASAVVQK